MVLTRSLTGKSQAQPEERQSSPLTQHTAGSTVQTSGTEATTSDTPSSADIYTEGTTVPSTTVATHIGPDDAAIAARRNGTSTTDKVARSAITGRRTSIITGSKKKRSSKSIRLMEMEAEIIELKLKAVEQRAAVLRAQIEEEEEDEIDDESVQSDRETTRRVGTWLDQSQPHMLAIEDIPHHREHIEAPAIKPVTKQQQGSNQPVAQEAAKIIEAAPQPPRQEVFRPAGAVNTQQQDQQISLAELITEFKSAVQTKQQIISPRYFVELPDFAGNYQEWLSFKTAYTETASAYSNVENMGRLRRSLKGSAKEAVERMLIHNTDPIEIIKALEKLFGRPDTIAIAEIDRLRSLQRLTDSPKDICVFANRISNIVATLRALNRLDYFKNPELTRITIDKLTPALRYRWYDFRNSHASDEPELIKLTQFLELQAEDSSQYAQPVMVQESNTSAAKNQKRVQKTYAATDSKASKCYICEEEHPTHRCKKFVDADVNRRWDIAKKHRLCYRCLRYRNRSHSCNIKKCDVNNCRYSHHRLLHFVKNPPSEKKIEAVTSTWTSTRAQAYLKIVPIRVSGPKGVADAHALLDDGSTVTLIDATLAKEIGADGPIDPLHIEAIGETQVKAATSRRVSIKISSRQNRTRPRRITARTIEELQLSPQVITEEDLTGCQHLIDIKNRLKYEAVKPRVLIGQDNWHLLLAADIRKGNRDQPVASLTPLGWVLHGAHTRTLGQRVNFVHHLVSTEENMDEQLRRYFAIENLTIEPKRPHSDPEQRALDILKQHTVQTQEGWYQTPLLWKKDSFVMPNNYENAVKRLENTEKKIMKNEELRAKYSAQMEALIEKGYAEPAPQSVSSHDKTWYLPHFAVINPMKPGKIRVVHDAAAKTKGVSLNDYLLTGPDLLQSLPGVLMRFRQHRIAVTADIAEMFMRVKIRPEDRDALRYLWRGCHTNQKPTEYRMTSLIFGATSSPSTAIYVKDFNASKYIEKHPEAVSAIKRNHYVDDYLASFPTEEEAIKISSEVRDIHRNGKFELRQWTSNSQRAKDALDDTSEQQTAKALSDGAQTERVLGLIWKPNSDKLTFNLDMARIPKSIMNSEAPTKRQALKVIMSLFDPLGFASPVTTRAKQILQEAWRRGIGWDQALDPDLAHNWTDWMTHLNNLRNSSVPRCYPGYTSAASRQLHIFVDASESAYAAALYWRTVSQGGHIETSLITAKSRVAPLKLTSIPRLELQAAVMGSRMAATVIEEHDIKPDSKIFWTDSRTVLTWLRTGSRAYKAFIAHRVAAIEENSATNEWRWIPSKLNVADDATRDVPPDFNEKHRWYAGPEFLRYSEDTWPHEQTETLILTGEEKSHTLIEKKSTRQLTVCTPDSTRFSKWEILLRSTARVLQFIEQCRPDRQKTLYKRTTKNTEQDPNWNRKKPKSAPQIKCKPNISSNKYLPITASLLHRAKSLLERASQQESFAEEIEDLRNNRQVSSNSRLRPLTVSLIDGLIRIKSRISAAKEITEEQKSPTVLDGNHHIVKLWIEYTHRQLLHAGVETTINECRQHYWILRLRPVTRMIVHRCLPCRIRRSMPPQPATGDHPLTRLAHHHRPFTYTGLDYFGPLTVTVGRSTQKRYVALFTCLTTRAVHLEIANSLSASSAIMALRRMMARRGCPTEIWSDNGTNLRGADAEMKKAIESTKEEAQQRLIKWRYIPPGAPFMGGAWERLVRSVKTALSAVLHERNPQEEVLVTLLAEAEYSVNSRPLTHVSVNAEDPEALTPNHFLLLGSARVPTPGSFDDRDLLNRSHWRAAQRLADQFWQRWVREYLPDLQYRREPHSRGDPLKEGDVVLIVDSSLPRNTWPRGIIVATYPGADGIVRTADVRTKGGVLRRPTKKLVILPTETEDPHCGSGCIDTGVNARREKCSGRNK